MTATGLDRRIALVVLSRVDARTKHIVIGAMVVGFLLSFIVPSTTARVACLVLKSTVSAIRFVNCASGCTNSASARKLTTRGARAGSLRAGL